MRGVQVEKAVDGKGHITQNHVGQVNNFVLIPWEATLSEIPSNATHNGQTLINTYTLLCTKSHVRCLRYSGACIWAEESENKQGNE